MSVKKLIYIAGYGRSGSTILDIVLNNHEDIVTLGEFSNFFKWIRKDYSCACKANINNCDFWGPIISEYKKAKTTTSIEKSDKIRNRTENAKRFPAYLMNKEINYARQYGTNLEFIFNQVFAKTNKDIIVDSSKSARKTAFRALALAKYTNYEVFVIHLIRDGRNVLKSNFKGHGSPERKKRERSNPEIFFRTCLSWTGSNIIANWMKKNNYIEGQVTIKFEDLTRKPSQELNKIGEMLNVDFDKVIRRIDDKQSLQIGHNVAGNRVRFKDNIVFKKNFKQHKYNMPLRYKIPFWILCGFMMYKFDY